MGNYYKDLEKVQKIVLTTISNETPVSFETVFREVRASGLLFGKTVIEQTLEDLRYQKKCMKITEKEYGGTYYQTPHMHRIMLEKIKEQNTESE